MEYTKREVLALARAQLALECGCAAGDFLQEENIITPPRLHPARRHFSPEAPFLRMTTMGAAAVVSADERLHPWLREFAAGRAGRTLFEYLQLRKLDAALAPYGCRVLGTSHMFLPVAGGADTECGLPVKWFEQEELAPLYAGGAFPNALCPQFDSRRPDVLGVAACDGDAIVGMAGCSADTPLLWQIGIDVAESHRGRGIGAHLVRLLKQEAMRRGRVPYYGAAVSNLYSWNIAWNCGFFPAWIDAEARAVPEQSGRA